MNKEEYELQLEYLKGGLKLIKKELRELKEKFNNNEFTIINIRRFRKVKRDYIIVNSTIKEIEDLIY